MDVLGDRAGDTSPLIDALPDGAEAPPPGVRTMELVRWALVALMAAIAAGAWIHHVRTRGAAQVSSAAVQYRCPMHPAVLQDRAGSCPVCGMDLVSATTAARGASEPSSGSSPASADAAASPGGAAAGAYWCPMHPEVSSDDPNARCEKCGGMKLLPRETAAAAASPPPGLVPVYIAPDRAQRIGIRTAAVVRERVRAPVRTVGFVSANESSLSIVSARFTGWIEKLRVAQTGQRVARGDVLATVYSTELVTAQTAFLNAVRWTEKQTAIVPGPGTPGGIESDARRRLELLGVAKQDIDQIAATGQPLAAVPLRSPVSGYVARKSALTGLYVQPGTELFQIVDLSSVWVVADVYERDLRRVQVGQAVAFRVAARPEEVFTGRVQFIYPAVDAETRTLQARVELRNSGLKLRPGMYGDVDIETGTAEALTVPSDAVVDTGERQYVFVSREGSKFEPRVVRTGARRDDRTEVLEGVAAGDRVVTTANFLVDSESRLQAAVQGFRAPSPAEEAAEGEGDGGDEGAHRRPAPRAAAR